MQQSPTSLSVQKVLKWLGGVRLDVPPGPDSEVVSKLHHRQARVCTWIAIYPADISRHSTNVANNKYMSYNPSALQNSKCDLSL